MKRFPGIHVIPETPPASGDAETPTRKATRGRGHPPHFTVEQVRQALITHDGCLHLTAKALGCARSTVQEYCYRHPELQVEAVQAREAVVDEAEHQLYAKVRAGDSAAMLFLLRTQGKSRGYMERYEPAPVHHDLSMLSDAEMIALGPILMKLQTAALGPPKPPPLALARSPDAPPA